jgi:hypothetical protein
VAYAAADDHTQIVSATVTPPAHLTGVPVDARGYLVPAETPWRDGVAHLSKISPDRTAALAMCRACAVCGHLLPPGQKVYRVFAQRDAAFSRMDPQTDDQGMAGHESCMIYSILVCPYWKTANARLGKDHALAPSARRGTRPALQGFADVMVMFRYDGQLHGQHGLDATVLYRDLVDDTPFREPDELLPRYTAAIESDTARIPTNTRHYWTDSPDHIAALTSTLQAGIAAIGGRGPDDYVELRGQRRVAFNLPVVSSR